MKSAQKTYESQSRIKTLHETVPRAWNEILAELLDKGEESYLYDLIAEETERICGFKPNFGVIRCFIEYNKKILFVDDLAFVEKKDPEPAKKKPVITYSGTVKASLEETYYGKKVAAFHFRGKRIEVSQWKEIIVGLCEILQKKHKGKFTNVYKIQGKKNAYFSKDPDSLKAPKEIGQSKIFVETNFSSNAIVKVCQRILEELGYSLDDLELEFSDQLYPTVKTEKSKDSGSKDTSPSVVRKVEQMFGIRLEDAQVKRGRGKYFQTEDSSKNVVFLSSKYYEKPKCYWFGLRLNQIQFLTERKGAYLALVCGSNELIFMEKWENIKDLIQKLSKTETEDRMYYHIKIFERDGQYILGLPELSSGMEISDWII